MLLGLGPENDIFWFWATWLEKTFGNAVSYQKKIKKNNGERIFALSIAVF